MGFNLLGFDLDDNIIWLLVILFVVFYLFPNNKDKKVSEEVKVKEEKEEYEYIYKRNRNGKERRRLVY